MWWCFLCCAFCFRKASIFAFPVLILKLFPHQQWVKSAVLESIHFSHVWVIYASLSMGASDILTAHVIIDQVIGRMTSPTQIHGVISSTIPAHHHRIILQVTSWMSASFHALSVCGSNVIMIVRGLKILSCTIFPRIIRESDNGISCIW